MLYRSEYRPLVSISLCPPVCEFNGTALNTTTPLCSLLCTNKDGVDKNLVALVYGPRSFVGQTESHCCSWVGGDLCVVDQ